MSFPTSISSLDIETKVEIIKQTRIIPSSPDIPKSMLSRLNSFAITTLTSPPALPFAVLDIDVSKDLVKIPFGYARKLFGEESVPGEPHPQLKHLSSFARPDQFLIKPRPEQVEILEQSKLSLRKSHGLTLQAQPGAGKTFMSIALASEFGLRTAILTPRETITKQWVKSIQMALPQARIWLPQSAGVEAKATVKRQKKSTVLSFGTEPVDCENQSVWDFAVMLIDRAASLPASVLNTVGLLVIDEAHMNCTKTRVQSILAFSPLYVISLTATLERTDGCHKMIRLVTGDEEIVIKPKRAHLVVSLKVPVMLPEIRSEKTQLLSFTELTNSIADCDEYNEAIVRLIAENSTKRKFIVLCSRVQHCKKLVTMLKDRGITSEEMCESKSSYVDCKAMVGTMSKVSVGFDAATCALDFDGISPDTLIVATSFKNPKDYAQSAGRVMRSSSDRLPSVVFVQTQNKIMSRHLNQLKDYIASTGGHFIKIGKTSSYILPESLEFALPPQSDIDDES